MHIIYKITNTINNKAYIGQTKNSLEKRWYGHIKDATTRKTSHKYHFLRALLKYGIDVWDKEIIECNISKDDINSREAYWIEFYDTYTAGYNSTLGGDNNFPDQTNNIIYTFYSVNNITFVGTVSEFCDQYHLNRYTVLSSIKQQGLLSKTWSISKDTIDNYIKKSQEKKTALKTTCNCGSPKSPKALTCFKCRDLSGDKNGMTGKHRPQHVKEAVSKRMRDNADKTLRDWVHPEHGLELSITSLDLRDKYSLNISHLKKITDNKPKYKTHKGWQLYARNNN